ncbi:MAG: response regulator transcription factor [Phycisphaeraceae bacterium]
MLIVDDHPVVRHGFAQRLNVETDIEVCGDAGAAHEALRQADALQPNVIMVDISLEEGSGLDLIKDLKSRGDDVRILVVSSHDEDVYAERCLRAGAHGYLHKGQAIDRIVEAVRQVARGGYYLSSDVASRALKLALVGNAAPAPSSSPVDLLSDRELQVFELLGQGMTVNGIADKLFLSPKTIETYRAHLKLKLNLANSSALLRHAMQWVLERA